MPVARIKPSRPAPAVALAVAWMALAYGRPVATAQQIAPAATPEVDAAVQREIQAAQDALARAVVEFEGPQQSRSIVLFDEVVARLEALGAGSLPPSGRGLLVQAYEYRGRAYFGIGLTEKASEDFRQLVQLKPDHALSKELVSPKIVALFDKVKKALVGYLAVSSRPAGATVSLVGASGRRTDLGLTDFFPVEVLAGEYTVEIARPGYQTDSRPVSITARDTQTLEVDLVRILASLFVVTEPAGVEVWVDGEMKVASSGSLAPDLHEEIRQGGLDPGRASARTEIANLPLGRHVVEFRRPCYETARRMIETPEPRDYVVPPVKMEDSVASLRLTSDPPGARIFLNGEARGVTPAQIDGICSGKVRVEVKHAAGKFLKDIVLARDEAVSLDCPIRPTLAFLGVEAEGAAGERYLAEAEEKIPQNLQRLTALNFVVAPREAVDRVLAGSGIGRKALRPGSGTDPDVVRRATDSLCASLEAQGLLLAVLPEERLPRLAQLFLLGKGTTTAEAVAVPFAESAGYAALIARLDARFASERPWTGLITVDTLLHEGVPVLRVVDGSPAREARLQPGDVVVGAAGQPVKQTADLRAAAAVGKPGDRLVLRVRDAAPGSSPRDVDLVLGASPREIPLFDPGLLYNKAMMDLSSVVEGYPGTDAAAYAWLNLALCAMHFSDFAGAHDFLQKAKAELPDRPGLSRGTALYYLGVVLDRLGYGPQAIEAYRAAGEAREATLIDNDGPAVSSLAARRASR